MIPETTPNGLDDDPFPAEVPTMWNDTFATQTVTTSDGVAIHLRHAGSGPPLLLLHGYPQTHVIWHVIAPRLAQDFHIICPDLRGYGDSAKPASVPDHANYAKRAKERSRRPIRTGSGRRIQSLFQGPGDHTRQLRGLPGGCFHRPGA